MTSESEKYTDFHIFAKNPRNVAIWWNFLLIMKGADNYIIHKKFQVYSTNIFGLGAKTNIARWQLPLSTPNFNSLPYSYPTVGWYLFLAKMTAKDDSTISSGIWLQKQAF